MVRSEAHVHETGTLAAPTLSPGTLVDRYVVVDLVGEGGMGRVYRAFDPDLDRLVAIKLLRPEHGADASEGRQALLNEARALARLSHPNVIHVYDAGAYEGDVFIATELVEGITLRAWLDAEPRALDAIVAAFVAAGRGLAAAHAAGLVHRDFKPENVVVARDGRVLVLDFGLARASESDESHEPGPGAGTLRYMAPEQHLGEDVDARSDQFSFAAALYEALHREHPFGADRVAPFEAIERAVVGDLAPPAAATRVPSRLRRLLVRALAPVPGDRFASIDELLAALDPRPPAAARWGVPLALVAMAIAASVAFFAARPAAPVCRGAEDRVAGAWDAARRDAVGRAIRAVDVPYAASAAEATLAALDGYAAAWTRMRTSACEATRVRGEQSEDLLDLRMACLDRRLVDLRAEVDVLARADREVAAHAVESVHALPPLAVCADAAALRARVPPPEDAAVRARVADVEGRLSRARALDGAGHYAEGVDLARAIAGEAEKIGYRPLQAETKLEEGNLLELNGDYEGARAALVDAVVAAEAGRDESAAAHAWAQMAWVVGERLARYDAGREAARHAEAILETTGPDPMLSAEVFRARGTIAFDQGALDEAEAAAQKTLALRMEATGPGDPRVAEALSALGDVARERADYAAAYDDYERAAEIWSRALGPEHPRVAVALNNRGMIAKRLGRYDDALADHRRAIAIWQRSLGPDHPHVAEAVTNEGVVEEAKQDYPAAIAAFERALEIDVKGDDPRGPAFDYANLSEARLAAGDSARALSDAQRARAIWEKTEGPGHHYVAIALRLEADAYRASGAVAKAASDAERAVAIDEKALGATHPDLADDLVALAEVRLVQHRSADATALLERALALRDAKTGEPREIARIELRLATALDAGGARTPRATALATSARDRFAAAGDAVDAKRASDWLAARATR